ncbi:MAG: hypothetical protein IPG10_13775 [Flavobacteriales bacterium]|nr:hypothetical protein [Flavobacteriales bacterium]
MFPWTEQQFPINDEAAAQPSAESNDSNASVQIPCPRHISIPQSGGIFIVLKSRAEPSVFSIRAKGTSLFQGRLGALRCHAGERVAVKHADTDGVRGAVLLHQFLCGQQQWHGERAPGGLLWRGPPRCWDA